MLKKLFKITIVLIVLASITLTIFWFSRPADISFDEARLSIPHVEYSHFIDVDGIKIHYQEKGTGTPLILLHGYTSSTYSWKDVFDPLSEKYRVIALDLKGFGFSDKPDGDYTRRAQAELIIHFLDNLKIERAWFCGNSMGGEISLNIALHNPNRVSGLILIDSGGVKTAGGNSLAPAYIRLPVIGRLLTALALTSDGLVRDGLLKSFYDDSKVTPERVAYYYRQLRGRNGQSAAVRARIQAGEFPVEQDLGRINAPTLLIWGAEDEIYPLESGKKMHSLIKNSKLVVIEKCGHVPQEETPTRVLNEVTAFIE
jgi:pimeloyl-ACP methyl ester carboxylesterase